MASRYKLLNIAELFHHMQNVKLLTLGSQHSVTVTISYHLNIIKYYVLDKIKKN